MNSFEKFKEKIILVRKIFCSSTKKWKIDDGDDDDDDDDHDDDDDGKISDSHISLKDYLTCDKIWNKFDINDMGDSHNHSFKKMYCY